jgi:hypothetical protein
MLLAAAALFRRHLKREWAFAATAVVALHGLLVFSASRGLRDELVAILAILTASAVLGHASRRRGCLAVAGTVGALAVVRWEIALLTVVLLAVAAAVRRVSVLVFLAAVLAATVTSGPWLVANDREYGSWQASSNQAAVFWYRADVLGPEGVTSPQPGRIDSSEQEMTWTRYYVDVVGPKRALVRSMAGAAGLMHDLAATALWPLNEGWLEERVANDRVRRVGSLADGSSVAVAWLAVLAATVGMYRSRRGSGLGVVSVLVVAAGCAAYGGLRTLPFFEPRFVEFTIPFAAVLLVWGASGLRRDPKAPWLDRRANLQAPLRTPSYASISRLTPTSRLKWRSASARHRSGVAGSASSSSS